MDLKELGWEGVKQTELAAQDKTFCVHGNEPLGSITSGELLGYSDELLVSQDGLRSTALVIYLKCLFTTDSFQQGTSLAADSPQFVEILRLLWKPTICHCVYNSPPKFPVLRQKNFVHNLKLYLFNNISGELPHLRWR